jgi:hypothetical protein
MTIPAKKQSQSYMALTQQVVREAEEPIPVAEITRRVHRLRPIEARSSPERLIRNAISQRRLVANTGDGKLRPLHWRRFWESRSLGSISGLDQA